ncbi:hypothetical protein D3C72_2596170 [compost metagenome]
MVAVPDLDTGIAIREPVAVGAGAEGIDNRDARVASLAAVVERAAADQIDRGIAKHS